MRVNLYDYEEYEEHQVGNSYWVEYHHIDTGESIFFEGIRMKCWECGGSGFDPDDEEDDEDEETDFIWGRNECPECDGVGRKTEYDYRDAYTYEEMIALNTQRRNLLARYGTINPKSIADYWDNPPKIVC